MGRESGENGEKGSGNKWHKCRYKIGPGLKNSLRNGKAKELMCMTHECELSGVGNAGEGGRVERDKGEKMGQL